MISVVIPLYNKEQHISKTLQSVFAQTYTDYEIVIVNDGSTDNSAAVVKAINDPRIRLINQANAGVSSARNKGIKEAKGEYVALLDADDEWKPEYLETIADMVEKYSDCSVFATNYTHIAPDGHEFPTIINNIRFNGYDGRLLNYFEVASTSSPPICSISIVAKKDVFLSVGGFPLGIKSGEDLLTWARFACRYKIAYCIKPLAIFNVEGFKIGEKPKRIPAKVDVVGNELLSLYQEYKAPFLKNYISLWHKMRSSSYLRLGYRRKSINEAFKALKYNPSNYKLYAYIMLNLLPSKLQKYITKSV